MPLRPFTLQYKSQRKHFSAISATMGANKRLVLWFRDDLRLTDNAALQTAASMIQKKQAAEVSIQSRRPRKASVPCLLPSL